jgi:hypothetical protein
MGTGLSVVAIAAPSAGAAAGLPTADAASIVRSFVSLRSRRGPDVALAQEENMGGGGRRQGGGGGPVCLDSRSVLWRGCQRDGEQWDFDDRRASGGGSGPAPSETTAAVGGCPSRTLRRPPCSRRRGPGLRSTTGIQAGGGDAVPGDDMGLSPWALDCLPSTARVGACRRRRWRQRRKVEDDGPKF